MYSALVVAQQRAEVFIQQDMLFCSSYREVSIVEQVRALLQTEPSKKQCDEMLIVSWWTATFDVLEKSGNDEYGKYRHQKREAEHDDGHIKGQSDECHDNGPKHDGGTRDQRNFTVGTAAKDQCLFVDMVWTNVR